MSIPFVIEKEGNKERSFDIYSRLLRDRIIFLNTGFDDYMASAICAQLILLEAEDSEADITLYVNSPGGSVSSGMAIYDTMQFIKPDVSTIIMGQACSMGSFIANAGAAGKRYMLPNARHMVHQVSAGTSGQCSDMEIAVKEARRINDDLAKIYVKHNSKGKTLKDLRETMDRDSWMTSAEALKYGLIDKIIKR